MNMPTFSTIATIWSCAVWVVGAITITAALALLLLGLCSALSEAWRSRLLSDLKLNLWVYRAMRAYMQSGHPRPDERPMISEKEKLEHAARALIDMAEKSGLVLTIETVPKWFSPLAMGNYDMVAEVREALSASKEGGSQ